MVLGRCCQMINRVRTVFDSLDIKSLCGEDREEKRNATVAKLSLPVSPTRGVVLTTTDLQSSI